MGSAGAESLCAFGVTQTPEQDGCDTEAFHPAVRKSDAIDSAKLVQLPNRPARLGLTLCEIMKWITLSACFCDGTKVLISASGFCAVQMAQVR
jgi:hypothetical protein